MKTFSTIKKKTITDCLFKFTPHNDVRWYLNSIYKDGDTLVTTDGHIIATYNGEHDVTDSLTFHPKFRDTKHQHYNYPPYRMVMLLDKATLIGQVDILALYENCKAIKHKKHDTVTLQFAQCTAHYKISYLLAMCELFINQSQCHVKFYVDRQHDGIYKASFVSDTSQVTMMPNQNVGITQVVLISTPLA